MSEENPNKLAGKVYWDKADALWPDILKAGELFNANPANPQILEYFQKLNADYKAFCATAKELDSKWQGDK